MSERRTYVVILVFWAILTVVTPMLIRLSASANLHARFDGEVSGIVKLELPRRALVLSMDLPAPSPAPSPVEIHSEEKTPFHVS